MRDNTPNMPASEVKPWEPSPWHERFKPLSELELTPLQQAAVMEWYATRLWVLEQEVEQYPDYYGKSYDPLSIELRADGSGVAHSYALGVKGSDNGRHHDFDSLDDLEHRMTQAQIDGSREWYALGSAAREFLSVVRWVDRKREES